MSSKNILVLFVLMISGSDNLIQAGVIHGVEIAPLDLSSTIGEWYLGATTEPEYQHVCMSNIVKLHSRNQIQMHLASVLKRDVEGNNRDLSGKVYNLTMDCVVNNNQMTVNYLKNVSNVVTKTNNIHEVLIVEFCDVQDNSYLILFTAGKAAQAIDGSEKLVFVFGQNKTLDNGFVEAAENDDFYKRAMLSKKKLLSVDSSNC